MKKITALAAALAIALSLAACGDSSNTSLIGKLIGQSADTNNSSSKERETETTKRDKNTNNVIDDIGSTEAFTTAKTEKITVTETAMQNAGDFSEEKKSFEFIGGNIEYVEYTYYILDEYDYTTEYIGFSAKVKLDNYPDSEKAINDVLNDIGNAPSAEALAASKAPESMEYGMMSEHNQISFVYAENDLLFVTAYYLWDGGGETSLSLIGYETIYIFDIKTGKQLKCEQIFKNFDAVKKLVVQYADEYIKENIPYEVYSQEPYFEQLVDYEWYNGSWKYDGKNFTVSYGYLFQGWMYKNIYVDIPADVIRPYFDFESKRPESGSVSKLADIVGPGVYPDHAPAPDTEVNAVLAEISREKRKELIEDLEYCVGMLEAIHGTDKSLFCDDKRFLGTADYGGYADYYYYDTYNRTFQDMFYNIRNCFSENFVSNEEIENISGGIDTFVAFGYSPQTIAWEFCPPNAGNIRDFGNAGVVSYSDTEAEVWVAGSSSIEAAFDVEIFRMVRLDTYDRWKIDKMWIANNGNIDNKLEVKFY